MQIADFGPGEWFRGGVVGCVKDDLARSGASFASRQGQESVLGSNRSRRTKTYPDLLEMQRFALLR